MPFDGFHISLSFNHVASRTLGVLQIRVWDSEAGDLYSLSIANENGEFTPSDILSAVSFDPRRCVPAGLR